MIDCDTRPELSGVADREEAVARREQAPASPPPPHPRTTPPTATQAGSSFALYIAN